MTGGDLAVFLVDVLDRDLYPETTPFAATAGPVTGRRGPLNPVAARQGVPRRGRRTQPAGNRPRVT
jgi:hypothetical protein